MSTLWEHKICVDWNFCSTIDHQANCVNFTPVCLGRIIHNAVVLLLPSLRELIFWNPEGALTASDTCQRELRLPNLELANASNIDVENFVSVNALTLLFFDFCNCAAGFQCRSSTQTCWYGRTIFRCEPSSKFTERAIWRSSFEPLPVTATMIVSTTSLQKRLEYTGIAWIDERTQCTLFVKSAIEKSSQML